MIEKIEKAVQREKEMLAEAQKRQRERELKGEPGVSLWPDEEEEKKEQEKVTFAMRAFPLLEMLRAAQAKKKKVMWGVP